jgi:hypothetical protein
VGYIKLTTLKKIGKILGDLMLIVRASSVNGTAGQGDFWARTGWPNYENDWELIKNNAPYVI